MADVFISHRKPDAEMAERLAKEIQAAGHDVWFDEWKIGIGDSIVERVGEGLEGTGYLVVCFSGTGLSPWMNREWMSALARQLSGHGIKILPVLFPGGEAPAIIADIRYADLGRDWSRGVAEILRALR